MTPTNHQWRHAEKGMICRLCEKPMADVVDGPEICPIGEPQAERGEMQVSDRPPEGHPDRE